MNDNNRISLVSDELTGHYSSTYVCVVKIDDGRFYVDYHSRTESTKYGIGRIFCHLNIDGVTRRNGVYIPGSNSRLSLEAIYQCETKQQAVELFPLVLEKYNTLYPGKVFSNKSKINKPEKPISQETARRRILKEMQERNNNPNLPIVFYKPYNVTPKAISSVSDYETVDKLFENRGGDIFTEVLSGAQNWISSSSVYARTKLEEEIELQISDSRFRCMIDTLQLCNGYDTYSFSDDSFSCYDNLITIRIVPMREYDDHFSRPSVMEKCRSIKEVFSKQNCSVLINSNLKVNIDEADRNRLFLFFSIVEFMVLKWEKHFELLSKTWIERKAYQSYSEYEFEKNKKIRCVVFDKENRTAQIQGSMGETYLTSLHGCTCKSFERCLHDKILFKPCKHMQWLAQKLELIDHVVVPDDSRYDRDDLVEMILDNKRGFYYSNLKTEYVPGWKNPLITFESRGSIDLWLNRHQIIISSSAPFEGTHNGEVFLNDEANSSGTLFYDEFGKGYYNITCDATTKIYEELLKEHSFYIIIGLPSGMQFRIDFPKVSGFANLYCKVYRDVFEKRARLESKKNSDGTWKTVSQYEKKPIHNSKTITENKTKKDKIEMQQMNPKTKKSLFQRLFHKRENS